MPRGKTGRLLLAAIVAAAGAAGLLQGPLDGDSGDQTSSAPPPDVQQQAPADPGVGPGLPVSGPVVADVTVLNFGEPYYTGEVDLRESLAGIEDGSIPRRDTFGNREGLLPGRPGGYYAEYVHPTPGLDGPGPQRIVTGSGGEIYYTPDHYASFIEIRQ